MASPDGAAQQPGPSPDGALVIGVGNDLRRDDGAGLAVIQELTHLDVPGLRVIWSHQLVPELLEPIAVARLVIFVDAAERLLGGVNVEPITASPPSVSGHQASPAALLGLARHAGLPVPAACVVSVPGHDFGFGTRLSPLTRMAVPHAVHTVLQLVKELAEESQRDVTSAIPESDR